VGFRFRRSVRVLPGLRLNLSKSGASVSLGPRGLHYTIGPKGTRTTIGIPGTGLSWTEYKSYRGSPARLPHPSSIHSFPPEPNAWLPDPSTDSEPVLTSIESKAGAEINALSTSELAPVLNTAHRRLRLAPLMLIGSLCLFMVAVVSSVQALVGFSALFATVFVPVATFLDRYRRSVKVSLKLNPAAETIAAVLSESFGELKGSKAIWSVRAEGRTSDWKRNAGATTLNQRDRIRPQVGRPSCVRGKVAFPSIQLGNMEIFFLPDAVLAVSKKSVAALHYRDISFSSAAIKFIEEGSPPSDARVLYQTWRYVNKDGGPDRRFNYNRRLPVCLYGEMDFNSSGGLNGKIQFSNASAGDKFAKALKILIAHAVSSSELRPIASYRQPKTWPSIVFMCCALITGAALAVPGVRTIQANTAAGAKMSSQTNDMTPEATTAKKGPLTSSSAKAQLPQQKFEGNAPSMAPMDILPSNTQPMSTIPQTQTYAPIPPPRYHQPVGGRH
jgi:Protein of unknown function (DUF4236)